MQGHIFTVVKAMETLVTLGFKVKHFNSPVITKGSSTSMEGIQLLSVLLEKDIHHD
jgi:hypothetical protein